MQINSTVGTLALVAIAAACSSQGDLDEIAQTRLDQLRDEPDTRSGSLGQSPKSSIGGDTEAAREKAFTAFESGQVRPLALSPDGKLLFAVNTPDNRLEIFRVHENGLRHISSVMVGLEPVAVAARSNDEVWVVNHLSDSVSIVDVKHARRPRVVRTLLAGDEPRDIVFAGPNASRAFVTTAHRGQNTGRDPQLTTPGVGRADVWVFDADNLDDSLAGTPLNVITLFGDTPRALAVTPDGCTVYAAAFHSGNRTTTIHERAVTNNGFLPPPNRPPLPPDAPLPPGAGTLPGPLTGLIVKYKPGPDGTYHWFDGAGRVWDPQVKFSLPDKDVFTIDAMANPPVETSGDAYTDVGTILFNMAVNPISGKVYVSNTDARNEVRFEGHNTTAGTGSVRGHLAESRITVLDPSGVHPRHLNKHLDYTRDGTPAEAAASLAFPMGMAVSKDGAALYVAAFGSSKLGVYDTSELEDDTFVPSASEQIELTGGGPSGLVLDEKNDAIYVLTRFDNSISVIDTKTRAEVAHLAMYNPEPASVVKGRRFLYDARLTSSHGDSACASCHIFGDFDSLAWDLGDPDLAPAVIPGPFTIPPSALGITSPMNANLKGPMTTQSLRGMANHGPMHWRGDRTGGHAGPSAQPNSGTFDEEAAFKAFNVAFDGLLGRSGPLTDAEMQEFTDFILQVTYPPNPVRSLDNSLTPDQEAGRAFYFNHVTKPDGTTQEIPSDVFHNCNGCHTLDPNGNASFGVKKPGFFGSDGKYSFESEPQFMKVPHLRNAYQKVGMFGMPPTWRLPLDSPVTPLLSFLPAPLNDDSPQGDQIRGFGFTHDGSVDTLFRFFSANVFAQRPAQQTPDNPFPNPGGIPANADGMKLRRQLEAFVLAFDSNLAPIVGQQTTLTRANGDVVGPRIALLEARARAGECELVVRGRIGREEVGYLYAPSSGRFIPNKWWAPRLSDAQLRARAYLTPLTFTAVPPGSGRRIGLDRDFDGVLDGDCDHDD